MTICYIVDQVILVRLFNKCGKSVLIEFCCSHPNCHTSYHDCSVCGFKNKLEVKSLNLING